MHIPMEAFVLYVRPALCVTGPAVRQSHGLYPARAGFYFSFAAVFSSSGSRRGIPGQRMSI